MKEALLAALKDAARDKSVRVVVLTGAGRAFSAGQDLKERQGPGAVDLGTELRTRYNPIVLAMRRLEKPVIGAINGVAAGAGISVALACDLRIAADNASFIEVFGRVGLVPDTGSTWFLPRLVGYAQGRRDDVHDRSRRCRHCRTDRPGQPSRPGRRSRWRKRTLSPRSSRRPPRWRSRSPSAV